MSDARRSVRLLSVASVVWAVALGCAPSSTQAQSNTPSGEHPSQHNGADESVAYSRAADPYAMAYQNEHNVFIRRRIAAQWLLSASAEPPGKARQDRSEEADQAMREAVRIIRELQDPCKAGVHAAIESAERAKIQQERRYLEVAEQMGDDSREAKFTDAHVHMLRDEIAELEALARKCPASYF